MPFKGGVFTLDQLRRHQDSSENRLMGEWDCFDTSRPGDLDRSRTAHDIGVKLAKELSAPGGKIRRRDAKGCGSGTYVGVFERMARNPKEECPLAREPQCGGSLVDR